MNNYFILLLFSIYYIILKFAVIVEEAAEVLESHIVASLTEFCQHLILIGNYYTCILN